MAKQFLVPIDLNNLEIQNVTLQLLASDPSSVEAKIYYNTGSKKIRFYNGTSWVDLTDSGSVSGIATLGVTAPITKTGDANNPTVGIDAATTSTPGSMSAADKTKLDAATNANTTSTIVMRDGSGNFSAGTITATLSGSASLLNSQSGSYYLDRAHHTGTQTASTISDLATVVKAYRLDEFAAPTSSVSLNSQKITGLGTPTADTDAATKGYVDAARTGLDAKESVRAATTANITLSGTQTIDGVSLIAGNRVLVKNQSTASANGIYVVASGAWTRATDADTNTEVTSGMFTFVEEGTTQANTGWVLSTANPIVVGTTNLTFVQFSGAGVITAGNGLTQSGNVISAQGTSNRISVSGAGIDIAATYVGQTSITTLGTIGTGTWQGTAIGAAYGGTGRSTLTANSYLVGNGTSQVTLRTPSEVLSDIGAAASGHNHTLDSLSNVTITSNSNGELLKWNGTAWINNTLAEAGVAAASHVHSASDITSGTLAVNRGGTGIASYTTGSYLQATGATTISQRTVSQVKSDIGLGNVENTALSTWAGTSNITTVGTIGTGTWQGTAIGITYGGTGATSVAGAKTNLGFIGRYATPVGNGTDTSFTVTHNFGTRDVTVQVYEAASPYDEVEVGVTRSTTSAVSISFATAPTSNQYRVVVTG